MVKASIIVVDYGKDKTMFNECIASIRQQTFKDHEIIVKDNTDDNVGFAKANNMCIKHAKGEYIILLNNDTIVDPNWLNELVQMAEENPLVGMISPRTIMRYSNDVDTLGLRINFAGLGYDVKDIKDIDKAICPSGVCALYRREALEDVGLFDEDFFMYCEDLDLGLRLKNKGWKFAHCPTAIVRHINGGSSRDNKTLPMFYGHRNNLWVIIKNYSVWKMILHSPFIIGAQLLTILVYFARKKPMLILTAKWNTIKGIPKMWRKRI